jgi:hypothetical protein
MDSIMKRLIKSTEEAHDVCNFEKRQKRTEFLTGIMGAHQHRISLFIKNGKLKGKTERVNGHIHKLDVGIVDRDILGFTMSEEGHKHRVKHKLEKATAKDYERDKKKKQKK